MPRHSNSAPVLADLAVRIKAEHEAANEALQRGLRHALKAGDLLIEARDLVPHGMWLPWLKDNCAFSERTAQLYMRLARHRPMVEMKSASLADLTLEGAAKLLAEPSSRLPSAEAKAAMLTPPEGHMLVGTYAHKAGKDIAYITPSTDKLYFFVTSMYVQLWDGHAFVTGLKKPIRCDYLEMALKMEGFPPALELGIVADWQAVPYEGPLDRNLWLEDLQLESALDAVV